MEYYCYNLELKSMRWRRKWGFKTCFQVGSHSPEAGAGLSLAALALESGAVNGTHRSSFFHPRKIRQFPWGWFKEINWSRVESQYLVLFLKASKIIPMYSQGGKSVNKIISKISAASFSFFFKAVPHQWGSSHVTAPQFLAPHDWEANLFLSGQQLSLFPGGMLVQNRHLLGLKFEAEDVSLKHWTY